MRSIDPVNSPVATHRPSDEARLAPEDMNPVTPEDLANIDGTAPAPTPRVQVPMPPMPGVGPELPKPEGPRATPRKIAELLPYTVGGTDANELPLNSFCMAVMAMQWLTESARSAWVQHARIKRVAETWRSVIKGQSIKAAQDRIAGERRRGFMNLGGSIAATAVSGGAGFKGAMLSLSQNPTRLATGQAIAGMANSLGGAVQNAVQVTDKTLRSGGARRADDADVRSRFLQRDEDLAQQAIDASRSVHESMKEQLRKAQDAIVGLNDRRQQSISMLQR